MATDHLFPRYHVRPPAGYVNDPNGPIRFGGRYHLYFQRVPDTPRTGPVRWGHATSADLVSWTLEPDALVPADGGGCWSGNVVESGGQLHAFFSSYDPGSPFQPVYRAESTDGYSFGEPERLVEAPAEQGCVQFRDPFVWAHEDRWWMVVGAGMPGDTAQARLYESGDLRTWRYIGPLASAVRTGRGSVLDTGMMWECPQYASFGEQGALFVGTFAMDGSGIMRVLSLVGTEKETGLAAPRLSLLDHGANFYAASVLRGPRNLLWGWATEGRSQDWANEDDWSGMLSLPREITLDGTRVASRPAAELTGLRTRSLGEPGDAPIPAQCELELHVEPSAAPERVRLTTGEGEQLVLTVDRAAGTLSLDRSAASRDRRASGGTDTAPLSGPDGPLRLRWFLDGSISELFTGTGHVLTQRFYPLGAPPWRLSVDPGVSGNVWALRTDAVA